MYHYVIVGAGAAGCVIAARLSEDPSTRVLLLEAGPRPSKKEVAIPAAFSKLFHTELDWDYRTVPQRHLEDRVLYWPRGRMLGGSSSLNAMMWVRGVPADYDAWAEAGNPGWAYADVLPYFKRAETADRPDPEHVGMAGPLFIQEQRQVNPGTHLFVEACIRRGIHRNQNANAGTNLGVDYTQVTQDRGRRRSASVAYLEPIMRRPNLDVLTGAHVGRVLVESGRAIGVSYVRDGALHTAHASEELILSGGAVNTPHLLQVSGIGPVEDLKAAGIEPMIDLPGVGGNLMDHLAAGVVRFTSRSDSLAAAETVRELVEYVLRRRGLLTSNVGEAHAFIETEPGLAGPDIELIFAPVPYLDHGDTEPPGHGYTVGAILLQPESRGTIRPITADPMRAPRIDPAYLSEPHDVDTLRSGVEKAIEVLDTSPLADVIGDWIRPTRRPENGAEIEAGIRRWAETLYHPAGTCRMGTDELAVVDAELRVHGIGGLRVADTSVMPTLNRGHTYAPAILIGEKAADLIRTG